MPPIPTVKGKPRSRTQKGRFRKVRSDRGKPRKHACMKKPVRRWRFWRCIEGSVAHRTVEAREEIAWLDLKGFKARIHAPLPRHQTSGHTHLVVLATLDELLSLARVEKKR